MEKWMVTMGHTTLRGGSKEMKVYNSWLKRGKHPEVWVH